MIAVDQTSPFRGRAEHGSSAQVLQISIFSAISMASSISIQSNRALDFRVAQQQLYRAQVASSPVDQRRLGSAQRVCAELERVEADAGDPLADETGVLTCRQASTGAAAGEQELAGLSSSHSQILVDGLPCLFSELL